MILIAESINIMSQSLGPAMRERNAGPIQEMAKAETEAGADYLDINIGPARRNGDELMDWVVKTVQEVSDLPLSLDTTNFALPDGSTLIRPEEGLLPVKISLVTGCT